MVSGLSSEVRGQPIGSSLADSSERGQLEVHRQLAAKNEIQSSLSSFPATIDRIHVQWKAVYA